MSSNEDNDIWIGLGTILILGHVAFNIIAVYPAIVVGYYLYDADFVTEDAACVITVVGAVTIWALILAKRFWCWLILIYLITLFPFINLLKNLWESSEAY